MKFGSTGFYFLKISPVRVSAGPLRGEASWQDKKEAPGGAQPMGGKGYPQTAKINTLNDTKRTPGGALFVGYALGLRT